MGPGPTRVTTEGMGGVLRSVSREILIARSPCVMCSGCGLLLPFLAGARGVCGELCAVRVRALPPRKLLKCFGRSRGCFALCVENDHLLEVLASRRSSRSTP